MVQEYKHILFMHHFNFWHQQILSFRWDLEGVAVAVLVIESASPQQIAAASSFKLINNEIKSELNWPQF